jgi:mono/diheme cytochrome c family protein
MKVFISILAGLGLASAAYAAQKLGEYQPERPPEVTYAKVCGYCHGKNVGPIILGRKLDTDMIKAVARHGRNGMPAFRPTEVTNAELDALAVWISKSPARPQEHGK